LANANANANVNANADADAHALVKLPQIQIILDTKSAEAGITGRFLRHGKVSGFPSSFYKLVQQLGRLDCDGTAPPGSNVYKVHVDFYSYVSLFVRVM
jgi:hypothetical protein